MALPNAEDKAKGEAQDKVERAAAKVARSGE